MTIQGNPFERYGLEKEILQSLQVLGYQEPTPIQEKVIPILLKGKDLVGKSQTGSGKTAAFGIPLCNQVKWEEQEPQVLILEPTRELAVQVQEELFQIGRMKKIKIPVVFGGMAIDKEILSLKQKSHLVVGTPGRVMDHIRRGSLSLRNIQYLVIDEADLMLDMGFLEEVGSIIEALSKVQISLFSATMGEHLTKLVERYMTEPEYLTIESDTEVVQSITQIVYEVENDDKFHYLMKVLLSENPKECMIFCGTREMVNTLYGKLRRKKIRCGMLHGGMEQRDRLYAIGDFRQGKFPYLITTDVAARGIDFPDMTHVINYDFPTNKENYVHRIGRTGRNGKSGKAISFIQSSELHYKKEVETYANIELSIEEMVSEELVEQNKEAFFAKQYEKITLKEKKGAKFNETITKLTIGGGKKSKIRPADIVGALCNLNQMSQEDIGVIDVRDSITYVEIFNGKGDIVYRQLQKKPIKGKLRKVSKSVK
ncbi:MAG: DEAD/DEAH box helicase [Eubacteriales bacterium]